MGLEACWGSPIWAPFSGVVLSPDGALQCQIDMDTAGVGETSELPRVDSLMFIKVILCLCLDGIMNMLLLSLIYLPVAYSYLKQFQIH